jgi:trehalose 6-phosphate synthase
VTSAPAPLLVVSNRLSLPDEVQIGGLAGALGGALGSAGGTWIGWSGEIGNGGFQRRIGRVDYDAIDFDKAIYDGYYVGFSNRALWPLLHSRLDLMEFVGTQRDAYLAANTRFADRVVAALRPDSRIWIHDYHLFPLAGLLRALGVTQRIGFFLHTPFPAPDIARTLPRHDEIFGALRHCDVIGVQTQRDATHLRDYLHALPGEDASSKVRAFPIGIDPAVVAAEAVAQRDAPSVRRLRESMTGRKLVISVDRLDYSKGLPARFTAYGKMFDRHPDLHRRVSFVQLAPISRAEVPEYRSLKKRLDAIAGDINARHGAVDWMPLRYVARSHPHAVISAFFREAAVGLVTPLRDGMNLVAKEYVAAQDPADPGVLVLSEFAGAAEQMDAALLVNPFDGCAMADALARALAMPLGERRERWEALKAGVEKDNLDVWRNTFLAALAGDTTEPAPPAPAPAPRVASAAPTP